MEGASCGHGAAWPLPNVLDSAIHHALHRAALDGVHSHRVARNGETFSENRDSNGRKFGSLQTAGIYPVIDGQWHFPRPADANLPKSANTTHKPLTAQPAGSTNSLASGLLPVVNTRPPSKEEPEAWISAEAYHAYLNQSDSPSAEHFLSDEAVFATEHNIGIAIDSETGSTIDGAFYSASYLRLKQNTRIGLLASCMDKGKEGKAADNDLIAQTFPNSGAETSILAGGQQRICTVMRNTSGSLPLPVAPAISGKLVRWSLLTPAIFPAINADPGKNIPAHPGGWLPTWIQSFDHTIQLKDPAASPRQQGEGRKQWRQRVMGLPPIAARLVAAAIPRAIPVTGWALRDTDDKTHQYDAPGGARATHLAVPAGAVYYFEADNEDEAKKLAAALNWHGSSGGSEIQNRRSSIFGEKGFGIGVCSSWTPHT